MVVLMSVILPNAGCAECRGTIVSPLISGIKLLSIGGNILKDFSGYKDEIRAQNCKTFYVRNLRIFVII
jgi:hypothetical protein